MITNNDLIIKKIKFNNKTDFIVGDGGSNNLIHITDHFVYKIIPYFNKRKNHLTRLDHDQKEINVYNILTNEFILKKKTPHIVQIYDSYKINITNIFNKQKCSDLKNFYLKQNDKIFLHKCYLLKLLKENEIKKIADVCILEKCSETISNHVKLILDSNKLNKYDILIDFINRICFQIIFTLAIIQQKYPSFVHNDFFLRNILGKIETNYTDNQYIVYVFNGKHFYLPANGFYVKINDFGFTLEKTNMLSTNILFGAISCQKCDLYNFLHDLYDGQGLGAKSVMFLIKNKSIKNINKVKNCFRKYIDVKMIDKINKINKKKLDRDWNISDNKFLLDFIDKPFDYLMDNTFSFFTKFNNNYDIVNIYNY